MKTGRQVTIGVVQHWVRAARRAMLDMWHNTTNDFEHGAIELEVDNIKTAYESLGKALDELGVPRLKPEHCKHPQELREDLNSSVARCNACGRLHAMVATRSGASRKWVDADDTRVAFGKLFTDAVLEGERERIRTSHETY